MKRKDNMAFIETPITKQTAAKPQKENKMKTTKETKAPKQPKTIKVRTLLKAAAIVGAIVAAYIAGIYTANSYNTALNHTIEQRAADLAKKDQGKQ